MRGAEGPFPKEHRAKAQRQWGRSKPHSFSLNAILISKTHSKLIFLK